MVKCSIAAGPRNNRSIELVASSDTNTECQQGRPTKYKSEYEEQAKKLCELGATDKDLANFFEVSESTLNLWKIKHPAFSESLKLGKEGPDNRVKNALYHRALGYTHAEVDIRAVNGEIVQTPITKHYPPDTTAMIFWLKNRCKEEFRDKPEEGGAAADDLAAALLAVINKQPD